MKKNLFSFALAGAMVLAAVGVQAKQYPIATAAGLGAAINTLINGDEFASNDTVVLTRGTAYTLGATVNTVHLKGITIVAEEGSGALPTIDCGNSDAFMFNAACDLPDAYLRMENIRFVPGTSRGAGKYFVTTSNTSGVEITYGGIEYRGCVFEIKSRAFLRGRVKLALSSIVYEDCLFQQCQDLSVNSGNPDAYGVVTVEFNGAGNEITNLKFKNTTFFQTDNTLLHSARPLLTNLEVENCSFLYSGTRTTASIINYTGNIDPGSSFMFRNNYVIGYCVPDGTAYSAPAAAVSFKASTTTPVSYINNYFATGNGLGALMATGVGGQITEQPLSKVDISVGFEGLTNNPIDYTLSGDDYTYMKGAGFGGACVGDPRMYPGYTPPIPENVEWGGSNGGLWNVAANWSPNGLPTESGTATISSGVAQSCGGKMNSTVILAAGGTLRLAAVPDTIVTLRLEGGTLAAESSTTLNGNITVANGANTTVSVAGSATLTLPVSLGGDADTLVKAGAGALELTATSNAFGGTWRVAAGAIKVAGAGTALGTEVKVDLCGGTLELAGEVVSLEGFFFAGGAALAVGTYTAASHPALVSGAGTLRITDSRVFRYVAQASGAWNSKFNWSPVRDIVSGDTAIIEGRFDNGEGFTPYRVEFTPTFPTGAKLYLRDGAEARLTLGAAPTATRSAFVADLEVAKARIYANTTSKNLLGLDGTLTIADTLWLQPDARVESDTVASGNMDNKISPLSIGAAIKGNKPIVVQTRQNPDNARGTYGVQVVGIGNLEFEGSWIVEKTSLVGKAQHSLGRSNTIYLAAGANLYIDAADATHYSHAVNAAEGAKISVNGPTRLQTVVLGGATISSGIVCAGTHPDYVAGADTIKLGAVPVTRVEISTPNNVTAAVINTRMTLTAVAYPVNADGREITWTVTAGDAAMDADTVVFGSTASNVTVKATTDNNTSTTKTIAVYAAAKPMTSLAIEGPSIMEMGETVVYAATYEPADATDNRMTWAVTAGDAEVVQLSNNRYQVTSTSTAPLTVKVAATNAPSVEATKATTINRATKYTWIANDALSAGSDGAWQNSLYWNPHVIPQAGDTAYVNENATEQKFAIGNGTITNETSIQTANFPAKLFCMQGSKIRVSITYDDNAGQDPFTTRWEDIIASYRATAPFHLSGGTLGVYSASEKVWGVDGEINVLSPSYIRLEAPGANAAIYVFAEVKGSGSLTIDGRESNMSNENPAPSGYTYSQSTVFLRRANPSYTGKWILKLVNLYTREAQGFGKADIEVGTGRKLIVDHAEAVDTLATLSIATGGKIATRLPEALTIRVGKLVLNGVEQAAGFYSRSTPVAASYFDDDKVIIKVGNEILQPVTSISISGPGAVAVSATGQYTALVQPNSAVQLVAWSVAPAELASINASGALTSNATAGCVTITATATDESGVSGTKTVSIGGASCGGGTGVAAAEMGTLTVSPNPVTSGQLTVDNGLLKYGAKIEVYSLQGTLVAVYEVASGAAATVINVSHLPQGTYIVKAGNRVAKVVKQ
jgi:autotransporter-associated beta strand protein